MTSQSHSASAHNKRCFEASCLRRDRITSTTRQPPRKGSGLEAPNKTTGLVEGRTLGPFLAVTCELQRKCNGEALLNTARIHQQRARPD